MPSRPISPSSVHSDCGNSLRASISAACGTMRSAAKRRTASRSMSRSSPRAVLKALKMRSLLCCGRVAAATRKAVLEALRIRLLDLGDHGDAFLGEAVGGFPSGDAVAFGELEDPSHDVANARYGAVGAVAVIALQLDRHIHQAARVDGVVRCIEDAAFFQGRAVRAGLELVVGTAGDDVEFQPRQGVVVDDAAEIAGGEDNRVHVVDLLHGD